jgi:hypothetical protein
MPRQMDSRAYLRENRESQRADSLARRMGGQASSLLWGDVDHLGALRDPLRLGHQPVRDRQINFASKRRPAKLKTCKPDYLTDRN